MRKKLYKNFKQIVDVTSAAVVTPRSKNEKRVRRAAARERAVEQAVGSSIRGVAWPTSTGEARSDTPPANCPWRQEP